MSYKIKVCKRNDHPVASSVKVQDAREEAAAACKLGVSHCITLFIPNNEETKPTTPAMSENMTKNPVAMFPKGK